MASLCSPLCGDDTIRSYCNPCDRQSSLREGGFNRLIFLDCDVTFTDVSDETEWEALVTAGKVVVLPELIGNTVDDETTTLRISACRPEEEITRISGVDFALRLFDNVTYTDFDLEYDLKNKLAAKTAMFIDCNGLLYYRYDWLPGENPGFGKLTAIVNRQSVVGEVQVLNTNLRWNSFRSGYKAIELTTALEAAILAACEEGS